MTQTMLSKLHAFILSCIIALLVPGCATQANKDPLEGINRGIYKFNDVADNAVIKPIAKAYKAVRHRLFALESTISLII